MRRESGQDPPQCDQRWSSLAAALVDPYRPKSNTPPPKLRSLGKIRPKPIESQTEVSGHFPPPQPKTGMRSGWQDNLHYGCATTTEDATAMRHRTIRCAHPLLWLRRPRATCSKHFAPNGLLGAAARTRVLRTLRRSAQRAAAKSGEKGPPVFRQNSMVTIQKTQRQQSELNGMPNNRHWALTARLRQGLREQQGLVLNMPEACERPKANALFTLKAASAASSARNCAWTASCARAARTPPGRRTSVRHTHALPRAPAHTPPRERPRRAARFE